MPAAAAPPAPVATAARVTPGGALRPGCGGSMVPRQEGSAGPLGGAGDDDAASVGRGDEPVAERTRSETAPGGAPAGPAETAGRPARTDTISVIPDVHDHDHDPLAAPGAAGAPNGQAGDQETAFVGRPTIRAQRYMISSVHYLATMGGLRILSGGGNAIDAGVAAGICINVVQPQLAMFGGVAPIIISPPRSPAGRRARPRVVTISGLGRWPRAARLEDYLARYGGDLPAGIPRTVTPAAPDAWLTALAEFGTMSLAEVLQPALELAEGGFPLHAELQAAIASAARPGGAFSRYPSTAAAFLPDGRVPQVGEVFRQPQLGYTFRRLIEAESGRRGRPQGPHRGRPRPPLPGGAGPPDRHLLPRAGEPAHGGRPGAVPRPPGASGARHLP